jgi:hypothetical protein
MTTDATADVDHLRSELLRRCAAHPVRSWSPAMLSAMIAVFDLWGSQPPTPRQPAPASVAYRASDDAAGDGFSLSTVKA